ncbi:MAG: hypothetical protein D4R97_05980 [Bacteroidetes bacterium]|nr:MAG: hypothetical protein D4R97_05980 [Bacteroidota bacterium]
MKRTFPVFLAIILLSGAFILFSCKAKEVTIGTLSVTTMTKDGTISTNTPVAIYLATSKADLDNKIYQNTGWLDTNGSKIFRDLLPTYYWYKVEGWDDYGAAEVYAGVDASVILWLNSPSSPKK